MRNSPVLAIFTARVTSGCCYGKCLAGGQNVKKRLFFYGVYMHRAHQFINKCVQLVVYGFPDAAEPPLSVREHAFIGAQKTFYGIRAHLCIEKGLTHAPLLSDGGVCLKSGERVKKIKRYTHPYARGKTFFKERSPRYLFMPDSVHFFENIHATVPGSAPPQRSRR